MYDYLNPERALIFRIEHVDNVPWNLQEGSLYCRNWGKVNPEYVNIGNPDLINARASQPVPIDPGGTLSDYVPFYFTPFSMMMFNIVTGRHVTKRSKSEIIIFVSSIHKLRELGLRFVFTNQHAKAAATQFYPEGGSLEDIDWAILRNRDFSRDDDVGKQVRYQAEALVYQQVPMPAILGISCFDEATKIRIEAMMTTANCELPVYCKPVMYF
jgi:hypothetical protein